MNNKDRRSYRSMLTMAMNKVLAYLLDPYRETAACDDVEKCTMESLGPGLVEKSALVSFGSRSFRGSSWMMSIGTVKLKKRELLPKT